MSRYPSRVGRKNILGHPTLTSTPLPSLKDLQSLSNLASGMAAISKGGSTFEVRPALQDPKMNENSKKPATIDMVCEAIKATALPRKGASVQVIKKYLLHQYNCEDGPRLNGNIRKALIKGLEDGKLQRPKQSETVTGAKGFFLLSKSPSKERSKKKTKKLVTSEQKKQNSKNKQHESDENSESVASGSKQSRPSKKEKTEENASSNIETKKPKKVLAKKKTAKSPTTGGNAESKPKKQPKKPQVTKSRGKVVSPVQSDTDEMLAAAAIGRDQKPSSPVSEERPVKAKQPKKPRVAKSRRKIESTVESGTDDTTLKLEDTGAVANRQPKLSSPVSDSEVTLVRPNIGYTDGVIRMNFSDTEMSMSTIVREPTTSKTFRTAAVKTSRQHPVKEGNAKKKLSLKTSKIQRKKADQGTTANSLAKKNQGGGAGKGKDATRLLKTSGNSIDANKTKAKATRNAIKDLSADSIIKPPTRRMLRRKSSV